MDFASFSLIACTTLIAVDGDTAKCDGENLRPMGNGAPHVSGFDAPEIRRPDCAYEAWLGAKAMVRFAELISMPGLRIYDSGERDTTPQKRRLVWIILPDGRSAGQTLIDESLAREWLPNRSIDWCEGNPQIGNHYH